MTLVAISAAYGAGGSRIAPALAERLGVPFIDRAIPVGVAERLDIPVEDVIEAEDEPAPSLLERLVQSFAAADPMTPAPFSPAVVTAEDLRAAAEQEIVAQAATGRGVILGRAAVIVLRDDPRALRVRLTGPADARLRRAMRSGEIDEETADRTLRRLDRAHEEYARRFYNASLNDCALYHLVLDSTAVPPETCCDVLALAAAALTTTGRAPGS